MLASAAGSLDTFALVIWAAAALWLPALLVGEATAPRMSYDVRRWSTMFPLGAVCSFAVAHVQGIAGIAHFARVWIWFAFAVWLMVFLVMPRRIASTIAGSAREHR